MHFSVDVHTVINTQSQPVNDKLGAGFNSLTIEGNYNHNINTHTHTHIERERKRDKQISTKGEEIREQMSSSIRHDADYSETNTFPLILPLFMT